VRRLEARDWVPIGVFVPLWAAALALHVSEGLRTDDSRLPFSVSSARANGHPSVLRPWRGIGDALSPPLEPGDLLIAVDGIDLRGVTAIGFFARAYTRAEGVRAVALEVETDGLRFPVSVRPLLSGMRWWTILPSYVGLGFVALFSWFARDTGGHGGSSSARACAGACTARGSTAPGDGSRTRTRSCTLRHHGSARP